MPEPQDFLIYGANGFTGRLLARLAVERGHRPVLAGRNAPAVEALARELGCRWRAFGLEQPTDVARALSGVAAVVHCAGPFVRTAQPMLEGAALAGVHYLDITGEADVFEWVFREGPRWDAAGITALPGVGFDVVPSDGLAARLKAALPDATHLTLAFQPRGAALSPGTTRTAVLSAGQGCRVRMGGVLVEAPFRVERFVFDNGPQDAGLLSWGDISTAFHSTGIPNVEVFLAGPPALVRALEVKGPVRWALGSPWVQRALEAVVARVVKGPTEAQQQAGEVLLVGRVRNAAGAVVEQRLRTGEPYRFTAESALAAVKRVLRGGVPTGAQTPSTALGADHVLTLPGVRAG